MKTGKGYRHSDGTTTTKNFQTVSRCPCGGHYVKAAIGYYGDVFEIVCNRCGYVLK